MRSRFKIANVGWGDADTIDPKRDPPVMFYGHETGEWEEVANPLSNLMALTQREGTRWFIDSES